MRTMLTDAAILLQLLWGSASIALVDIRMQWLQQVVDGLCSGDTFILGVRASKRPSHLGQVDVGNVLQKVLLLLIAQLIEEVEQVLLAELGQLKANIVLQNHLQVLPVSVSARW